MISKEYLAGAFAGCIEVTLTHPFDYIKTKIQQKRSFKYLIHNTSFSQCYSGYTVRLLGVAPMRMIFWGTQKTTESLLKPFNINVLYKGSIIGIVSASAQTILDTPIEVMKIAYMNKSKHIIFTNLFNGFSVTLYRNILFANCVGIATQFANTRNKIEKIILLGSGGLVGSIISQPLDYVKTQKQLPEPDKRTILRVLQEENIQTLFRGGLYRALLGMSTMSIGYTIMNLLT